MLFLDKFSIRLVHGMALNPLTMRWMWIKDCCVNYAMHAVKPERTVSSDKTAQSSTEKAAVKDQ